MTQHAHTHPPRSGQVDTIPWLLCSWTHSRGSLQRLKPQLMGLRNLRRKHLLWMVMSAQLKQPKQSAAEKRSVMKFSCTQGSKSEYLPLPKSGQYCSGSLLVGRVHISLQTEKIQPTGTKAGKRGRDRERDRGAVGKQRHPMGCQGRRNVREGETEDGALS